MFLKPEEQLAIIQKGVDTIVNTEELLLKLQRSYEQQQPLTIKLGLDPSAPHIHLGHAVVLRKIKQMQNLGHHAVILIGDFTGRIGYHVDSSNSLPIYILSYSAEKYNSCNFQKYTLR